MKLKPLTPLIPYIAVVIGVYCLSSAWVAIISYHVGMLLAVAIEGNRHERVRTKRRLSGWGLLSCLIFASGGIALYVLWPYAFGGSDIGARLASLGVGRSVWPYFAVYFCCVNSVVEELFWRGYLGDDRRSLTLNDAAFAGYHALVLAAFAGVIWCVPAFLGCIVAGWLWRMMRTASGSLLVPMLTHLFADASIIAAVHLRIYS